MDSFGVCSSGLVGADSFVCLLLLFVCELCWLVVNLVTFWFWCLVCRFWLGLCFGDSRARGGLLVLVWVVCLLWCVAVAFVGVII